MTLIYKGYICSLMVDTIYEHIREDCRVVTEGMQTVKGIDQGDYREILSVAMDSKKKENAWSAVFSDLIDRGLELSEIKHIVSVEHKGSRRR